MESSLNFLRSLSITLVKKYTIKKKSKGSVPKSYPADLELKVCF